MGKANPHRVVNYNYDTIIIGDSVEAMVTAYVHQLPIFGNCHKPLPFDFLPYTLDLSSIHVQNKKNVYKLPSKRQDFYGMERLELWNIMLYRLGIMGLAPLYGEYNANLYTRILPISNSGSFTISAKNKLINVIADRVIYFDALATVRKHKVNDTLKIRNIKELKFDRMVIPESEKQYTKAFMDPPSPIFDECFLYKEGRNHYCCVKSQIHEEGLEEWSSSHTACRLYMEKHIGWNLDKKATLEVHRRETTPVLLPMYDDLEEIISLGVFEQELQHKDSW